MNVAKIMTRDVTIVEPDEPLTKAAATMRKLDAGSLPVGENDRLIGMLTDRDIAIRAVGAGKDPATTKVRDVMSKGIHYCFDDEDVEECAEHMAEWHVRRLPVLNRDKRLVGIVSLGDVSNADVGASAGALRATSR